MFGAPNQLGQMLARIRRSLGRWEASVLTSGRTVCRACRVGLDLLADFPSFLTSRAPCRFTSLAPQRSRSALRAGLWSDAHGAQVALRQSHREAAAHLSGRCGECLPDSGRQKSQAQAEKYPGAVEVDVVLGVVRMCRMFGRLHNFLNATAQGESQAPVHHAMLALP